MATDQTANRHVGQRDDQWQKDLNPNPNAGINDGPAAEKPGRFSQTAADVADLEERLSGFSRAERAEIPVLKPGDRLEQGATYVNLQDPKRQEFTGMADMSVAEHDYIVPKSEVGYPLWNRLVGDASS